MNRIEEVPTERAEKERLNRFLARAGVASRRASDRLIQAGLVEVNGRVAVHPGVQVDPAADRVVCRGEEVRLPDVCTYLMLNKPAGYLVSAGDPHHRRTVYDLLADVPPGVFSVGRLDLDTWGVLLLTDDGVLGHRLMHPRYEVPKTYRALVKGRPSQEAVRRLREGVMLDDGLTAPARARVLEARDEEAVLELTLHEGRKHEVKRMCRAVGHPVKRLERVVFAGLAADGLKPGQWRRLLPEEVRRLKQRVGLT